MGDGTGPIENYETFSSATLVLVQLVTPVICGSAPRVTISCGNDPGSDLHINLTTGTSCKDLSTMIAIRMGSGAVSYIECNIDPYQVI